MIRNVLTILAVSLLLSACVLQAEPPFFSESDGVAVLGGKVTAYDGYELKDGTWSKSNVSDPPLEFAPDGNHYMIAERGKTGSGADRVSALFVPLSGGWIAMQLTEAGKPSIYSLAKLEDHNLLVAPIMCSDLKGLDAARSVVEFPGSDCTAKGVTDARSFLQSLAKLLPPPKMKLVPIP